MIPSTSISSFYARIAGERVLLALAQGNLMANLDRITKVRTHTFLVNNGQNENGVSHNFGAQRFYIWGDTTVDCRHAPSLANKDMLQDLDETIAAGQKFKTFKRKIEERSGGKIEVQPFYSVHHGVSNMRYDIRHGGGQVIDFDILRVGVKLSAQDEASFKEGLENIRRAEDPIYMCKPLTSHRKGVLETA